MFRVLWVMAMIFFLLIFLDSCRPTPKTIDVWVLQSKSDEIAAQQLLEEQPGFPLYDFRKEALVTLYVFQNQEHKQRWMLGFLGRLAEKSEQTLLLAEIDQEILEAMAEGKLIDFYGNPKTFSIGHSASFARFLKDLEVGDTLEVVISKPSLLFGLISGEEWNLEATQYSDEDE